MIKKIFFAVILIVIGVLLTIFSLTYLKVNEENNLSQAILITIKPGTSFNTFTKLLIKHEVIDSRFWIRNYVRINKNFAKIKAGTYQIKPKQTYQSILQMITNGKEHQFSITFVEGITLKHWIEQLKMQSDIVHEVVNKTEPVKELVKLLGIKHQNPEGLFFPDTYAFTHLTTDVEIFKRAYIKMQQQLDNAWNKRVVGLPYDNAYQALIMASIIEKESGKFTEHRTISSVFVNRLNKKMRLQTDPTVIYGLGERYKGDIKRKHLREKTAYNTYRINGLPPTPIAMPGLSAIQAVMNPADTDYFYFVSNGKGKHIFSTTLTEHNKAVVKYQLAK